MRKFFTIAAGLLMSAMALEAQATTVSFYFQDGEEDDFELENPQNLVSIWNATEEEPVTIPSDMAFVQYDYNSVTMLRIEPSDFDFEVTVSVEGDGEYNLDKEDNQYFLTVFPDSDDIEVFIRVYQAGFAPSDDSVELIFNIENPQNLENPNEQFVLSYFDRTLFQTVPVEFTSDAATVTVVPGTSFTLKPESGIGLEVVTYSTGVVSISQDSNSSEWYVAVAENPAETSAVINITLSTQNVFNLDFTSKSIQVAPEDFVTISSSANLTLTDITNEFLIPDDGLQFSLEPKEGYLIPSVTVLKAGSELASNQLSSNGVTLSGGEEGWSISLTTKAAGVTFLVNVETSDYVSGISAINAVEEDAAIYNLQGVKVAKSNITSGVYIINGKKVVVK